jgi:hypothetical protein
MAKLSLFILCFIAGVVLASPVVQQHREVITKRQLPPFKPSSGSQMSDDDWVTYIKFLKEKDILFRFFGEPHASM